MLKARGQTVPRPNYEGGPATEAGDVGDEKNEDDEEESGEGSAKRKNHEATSEEEA